MSVPQITNELLEPGRMIVTVQARAHFYPSRPDMQMDEGFQGSCSNMSKAPEPSCLPLTLALQEFTSDLNSRPVKRIEDVMGLRVAQFPEDAGPMAHPIRPDSYIKMDNFYTVRLMAVLPCEAHGCMNECSTP